MPFKAFGLACAVVVLSSPLARAQVNFDELFDTLAFNDNAPPPLPVEPPAQLRSPNDPAPLDRAPLGEPDEPERSLLAPPTADPGFGESLETYQPDEIAIDSPGAAPGAGGSRHHIDFDALLSDCDTAPTRLHSPTYHETGERRLLRLPPPHVAASCAPACSHPGQRDCKTCITYTRPTPYLEQPNLPPPISLDGYYRTPACYRDLWGGYHQQRQHECQCHHKHLHGHCECLNSEPSHPGHPGDGHPAYGHPGYGHPGYGHPARGRGTDPLSHGCSDAASGQVGGRCSG